MWMPRATARARAVRQPARMRSSSHSAHESIMRRTSLPWSVDRSNPSWTETNVPPAACMRSTAARLWIRDRPKRSNLATTSPSLAPDSIRDSASSSSGRSARAPETSSSSNRLPTRAPRIEAQALICSPWTTGEMKLSPSLPRSCDTRTYPSMTMRPAFDAGTRSSPVATPDGERRDIEARPGGPDKRWSCLRIGVTSRLTPTAAVDLLPLLVRGMSTARAPVPS